MLHSFSGVNIRALRCVLPAFTVSAEQQLQQDGLPPQHAEQILKLYGFKYCRQLPPPDTFTDMMMPAIRELLQQENLLPQDIDGLISVTQSPNYLAPSNSFFYHHSLGCSTDCVCLDLYSTCSGLFNALLTALSFITSGAKQRILIIVGESFRFNIICQFHEQERLLSDGGGMLIVEASDTTPSHPITLDFSVFSEYATCSTNKVFSLLEPNLGLISSSFPRIADTDYRQNFQPDTAAISSNNSSQRMMLFKATRVAQQQILMSLQRLLQHHQLKLSDLGCGVMYQPLKGVLEQLNTALNQAVHSHLKNQLQQQQATAQTPSDSSTDKWSCFDVERPEFFPFVAEDIGHLYSASQIVSLSSATDRLPDCTTKPIFLSAFGAGMSITSALLSLTHTHIYPPFIYPKQ